MTSKTERKLAKSTQHVNEALTAAQDLTDWLASTDVADWDADVILAQAKILEAAGCHVRRTLAAIQAEGLVIEADDDQHVCDCPYGNAAGITIAECKQSGNHDPSRA